REGDQRANRPGGGAFVAMVDSANFRDFHHSTHRCRLNWSTYWCVLAQRQVSPRSFVVVEVGLQDAAKTSFIQNNDMIQALTPDRPDQALDVGILPRRLRSGENFLYA